MKFGLQRLLLMILFVLFVAGCGNGGGDYNGNLTVTTAQTDNANGTSNVSFTIRYVKSGETNYAGLYCKVTTNGVDDSFTFASSGIMTLTYPNVPNGYTVTLQAQVGDIVSGASITSKATTTTTTLSLSPSSASVSAASPTATITISGGSGTYSVTSSSDPAVATGSVSGSVLTITRTGSGTATITISDGSATADITVTST